MFFIYFYGIVAAALLAYVITEKEKLRFYKALNHITKEGIDLLKLEMPTSTLKKLAANNSLQALPVGNALLFEHRTSLYMAIPLADEGSLIRRVEDEATITQYRDSVA